MIDGEMMYHYNFPDEFPWIIGCFKGCLLVENNPRELAFANNGDYGCSDTPFPTTSTLATLADRPQCFHSSSLWTRKHHTTSNLR